MCYCCLYASTFWLICIRFIGLSDLCCLIFASSRGVSWLIFFWCMLKTHVISFRLLWISVCSFCVESECIFMILLSSTNFSTLASNTSGQRLLRKADFHLGQHINTFFRIRCKMTENSADRKHLQGAEKRHITMFGTYLSITYRALPLSETLISICSNIWNQMIEELYQKIPHTSGNHICGPQTCQQKTLFCLSAHMFWNNNFLKLNAHIWLMFSCKKEICIAACLLLTNIYIISYRKKILAWPFSPNYSTLVQINFLENL